MSQLELDHSPGANSTESGSTLPVLSEGTCTCPGETHPIPFSVHLARLASGYAACGDCRHNAATGRSTPAIHSSIRVRSPNRSLITEKGVRGIYLNELDRTRAADWGAAFASMLWDERPRTGRTTNSATPSEAANVLDGTPGVSKVTSPRRRPVVVIGFDERPSSPDMMTGVALGLRRMGCQVIDLGQTIRPCFHFSIHHLEAAGGVFVTGDGFDPAWTGFHFAGSDSVPWSQSDILAELQTRAKATVPRPTRAAGSQRSFHAAVPYQTGLWKLFHALRPLEIVCGTASRQLPRVLDALFTRLPCKLTHEALPVRARNLGDPNDPDVRRVASATLAGQHHVGIVIDDDCERCAFVTEQGTLVSAAELARLIVLMELHEYRSAKVLVDQIVYSELVERLPAVGPLCLIEQADAVKLPGALQTREARLGIAAERIWFDGDYSACDAIRTLARVMQALSLSDAPMSQLLTNVAT